MQKYFFKNKNLITLYSAFFSKIFYIKQKLNIQEKLLLFITILLFVYSNVVIKNNHINFINLVKKYYKIKQIKLVIIKIFIMNNIKIKVFQ